jgi:hypothetical protein
MYAFVKVGSTGWADVVLVRLSWTTASLHGVVVHHRYGADRGQPLQKIMEAVWTISSESNARSKPCIVFPSLRRILW